MAQSLKLDHKSLFILEIINWSIGIILFILFLCKENNRYLVMKLIFPNFESKRGETQSSQPTASRSTPSRVSNSSDESGETQPSQPEVIRTSSSRVSYSPDESGETSTTQPTAL